MYTSLAFQSPLSNLGVSNLRSPSTPSKCSFSRSSFITIINTRSPKSQIHQPSPCYIFQPIRMAVDPNLPSTAIKAFLYLTTKIDIGPFSNIDIESAGLFGAITAGSLLAAFVAVFITRF